ncbi:MAG: RNA ligase family protein, partial [Peptostreptococcaceae bacterium]
MEFKKYQHIERFGRGEVRNIELGTCYVFPKIDGTNAQVYLRDGELKAGSRNRELSLEQDNAGFYAAMLENDKINAYLKKHPTHRVFGEWLVPHSLKTYRDDAWRRFYIFDVCLDKEDGTLEYIPYDIYKVWLEEFDLDYVSPLKIVNNGSYEHFVHELENNNFMIKNGM